jgi:hypothetical protein
MSTRTACGTRLRRGFHGGYGAVALKRVCTVAHTRKRILLRVMAAMALVTFAVPAAAQTPYIPYFGKNQIRYDKFEWYRYETDHFIIYYYQEIEPHLERMSGNA